MGELERVPYAEVEARIHTLLDHHQKWLLTQPEMLLLWPLDRATRHRVASLLAKELLTIPTRDMNESTPPNRTLRRSIMREIRKAYEAQLRAEG